MVIEASDKEKLDEVDLILAAEDGQIKRSRDPKMCHHNARQKCAHCLPIDVSIFLYHPSRSSILVKAARLSSR
ncbi:unnamed protein product [Strongylus vulgaris]|uniref:NPL4 zinc-binding putative domain-containing protein n=1 Tax=Strongylus vulgaris TaxID=40348 RepID=A0A3P7JQ72_STRVU|nr:unnamed protein product [Strongylus vulgaris]